MNIPRIVIAGTHSGCGKTMVATGLMGALKEKGLKVQPFKVGPDFIDPTYHSAICGRPSRNLDPFMMGDDGVINTFVRACDGADIAIIEGVMGMYDGLEGTDISSTANVARLLSAPVLLVVDVSSMSRSANALIKGFKDFDQSVEIAGVIFNRVGSPGHRRMIEDSLKVKSAGWIPGNDSLRVKSRHLGLRMADEVNDIKRFGGIIGEYADIDLILETSRNAEPLQDTGRHMAGGAPEITIGVAKDPAFCFYYQDNLDALSSGARLVFFSPMDDGMPQVDALYFGGGYPELYAGELERSTCRGEVKKAIDDGMPVYGECGGLMYLCRELSADKKYRLVDVLPADAEMTARIQALGYIKGESVRDGIFGERIAVSGHEFHFSRLECDHDVNFSLRLSRGKGIMNGLDGLCEHQAIGAYTHSYFSTQFVQSFIEAAKKYKKK